MIKFSYTSFYTSFYPYKISVDGRKWKLFDIFDEIISRWLHDIRRGDVLAGRAGGGGRGKTQFHYNRSYHLTIYQFSIWTQSYKICDSILNYEQEPNFCNGIKFSSLKPWLHNFLYPEFLKKIQYKNPAKTHIDTLLH